MPGRSLDQIATVARRTAEIALPVADFDRAGAIEQAVDAERGGLRPAPGQHAFAAHAILEREHALDRRACGCRSRRARAQASRRQALRRRWRRHGRTVSNGRSFAFAAGMGRAMLCRSVLAMQLPRNVHLRRQQRAGAERLRAGDAREFEPGRRKARDVPRVHHAGQVVHLSVVTVSVSGSTISAIASPASMNAPTFARNTSTPLNRRDDRLGARERRRGEWRAAAVGAAGPSITPR